MSFYHLFSFSNFFTPNIFDKCTPLGVDDAWRCSVRGRGVNLVRKRGVVISKSSTDGGIRGTGLKVSSPEFSFNNTQILRFLKRHHFGKCSHFILLYIVIIFHGDIRTPIQKSALCDLPTPTGNPPD